MWSNSLKKVWTIFVFVSKSKDDNFCTMEETNKNPETYIQTNSSFVKKIYLRNQITSTKMGIRNCKKRQNLKDIKSSHRKYYFNNFLFFGWISFLIFAIEWNPFLLQQLKKNLKIHWHNLSHDKNVFIWHFIFNKVDR